MIDATDIDLLLDHFISAQTVKIYFRDNLKSLFRAVLVWSSQVRRARLSQGPLRPRARRPLRLYVH